MEPELQKDVGAASGKGVIDAWVAEAGEERLRRGRIFSEYLDEWNAEAGGIDEGELAAAAAEWPDLS